MQLHNLLYLASVMSSRKVIIARCVHMLDYRNQNIGELFGLGEFLFALDKQCNKVHGFKLYCFRTCVLNDLYSKILAKTLSVQNI